mmetsp:Transcript_26981/g.44937  ORF Transcript_26981/g.44937 Transcript_26981/m.44937 type:complete len:219 (-) Transcript_26981:319-975(-)
MSDYRYGTNYQYISAKISFISFFSIKKRSVENTIHTSSPSFSPPHRTQHCKTESLADDIIAISPIGQQSRVPSTAPTAASHSSHGFAPLHSASYHKNIASLSQFHSSYHAIILPKTSLGTHTVKSHNQSHLDNIIRLLEWTNVLEKQKDHESISRMTCNRASSCFNSLGDKGFVFGTRFRISCIAESRAVRALPFTEMTEATIFFSFNVVMYVTAVLT